MHTPDRQRLPPVQRTPQAPQLDMSLDGSTQRQLQRSNPPPQELLKHEPLQQVWSTVQARPQTPQFSWSLPSEVSQPLANCRSQSP